MKRRSMLTLLLAAPASQPFATTPTLWRIPPGGLAVPPGLFGMHVHHLALHAGELRQPTPWPSATITGLRMWDSGVLWSEVAPEPTRWSFARMDAYVNAAQARGASLLFTLGGGTPRWASARPQEPCSYGLGCAAEPKNLADWETYLRVVMSRYKGRIGAYELWNEPNFSELPRDRNVPGFYTGSLALMLEMTRIARRVLSEEDPAALLCSPGFVNGPDRLEMFLSGGGTAMVDVINYHFYARSQGQLLDEMAAVRAVAARCGAAHLPLWNTEFGVDTWQANERLPEGATPLSDAQAAALMARWLVLNAANGIARCYYYAWDSGRSGMLDTQGVAQPRRLAYLELQRWLDGARVLSLDISGDTTVCTLDQAGQRSAIAWVSQGTRVWRPPLPWRVTGVSPLLVDAAATPSNAITSEGGVMLTSVPLRIQLAPMTLKRLA